MVRALVTGASGFIGSHLVRRLIQTGDDVTGLVRPAAPCDRLEGLAVRIAMGDIRDGTSLAAALPGMDVVYHLAGLVTALTPAEMMETNAQAFRTLLAACDRRETPPVVVFVSSLAAAGPSPADRPRVEIDPPAPVSNYGRSKRAAELIAEEFADRVPITVVRPPIVFGEGDENLLPIFRSVARYGVHPAVGVASSRYSLVHVEDLAAALLLCAQRGARLAALPQGATSGAQGYYFVACEEQPTFAELGEMIAASLDRRLRRVLSFPGAALLWPAALVAEAAARVTRQPNIFNFDKVREARAGHWICSAAAIRRELGFNVAAPLIDRLRETAAWYRAHGCL